MTGITLTNLERAQFRTQHWDQTAWMLHKLINDLNDGAAMKWADTEDKSTTDKLKALLREVSIVLLDRYQTVINEQISILKECSANICGEAGS